MSSRILVAALGLLSLGLGLVAWHQHSARLDLENQLRHASVKVTEPAKPAPTPDPAPVAKIDEPRPPTAPPAMDPDIEAHRAQVSARNDTPEAQRQIALQSRSALDGKYAALFMYLDLSPEKLAKLQGLLQDRQNVFRDVVLAMRTQGLAPTPENAPKIQALVSNAAAEIEAQIQASLGEADYARYQKFQTSPMARVTAERIQLRLSYTSEPLSASQYSRLMDVLMPGGPASGSTVSASGNASAPPLITAAIIDQARGFLSPTQLSAMGNIQREQQASAELAARQASSSP